MAEQWRGYNAAREDQDIKALLEWSVSHTEGKDDGTAEYAWGVRTMLKYMMDPEEHNPANELGPVTEIPAVIRRIKRRGQPGTQ